MTTQTLLPDRTVIALTGKDRATFLQGLISNDVTTITPGHALWSAFLSPQGKYLSDFFLFTDEPNDRLLMDCPASHAPMLVQKLSRFRLRADVQLTLTDLTVAAAWDEATPKGGIIAKDPRLPHAGHRIIAPTAETPANPDAYTAHRLTLALPDAADCEQDKTLLLEANFDVLHGISWTKGCYMGQELTARTRYRGLVRKRLIPVHGPNLPPIGTDLKSGPEPTARTVGTMRSSLGSIGLAFVRTEAFGTTLHANGIELTTILPAWLPLPEPAA